MRSISKSKVYFFHEARVALTNRSSLKRFIELIFKMEKKRLKNLNYIFCSDQYLLNINRQFLKHDYYTDIITFELSGKNQDIEGEIYISVDRVVENAKTLKVPRNTEVLRVIFHGALHLCNYQDKTEKQKKVIRAREDYYLALYQRKRST
jgi:probable rRNA maturation factor